MSEVETDGIGYCNNLRQYQPMKCTSYTECTDGWLVTKDKRKCTAILTDKQ